VALRCPVAVGAHRAGEMVVILVVGATGRVGRQLVDQLGQQGMVVRAVTRRAPARGLSSVVEVACADLADASSLEPHLEGVEAVFLLWPFTLWVPNWSSRSCELGVFVDQSAEPVAASDAKRGR
jgi:NAD(P)-dependent dehydrogenase (short-subunit alcohol dehydrogenase family)